MQRCKEEGLVAHLGVAGGPIPMLIDYVETGLFEVAISHNRYTLLNVSANPLWDACVKHGVAAVNAAPYGSGLLAKGPSKYPRYAYQEISGELMERALELEAICARHNVPLAAAALQFSLRDPRITSTIVGMSRPERLQQTVALAEQSIPEDIWAELAAVAPGIDDPEAHRFG
jgi:D-threo-aldose 1-dehydrogenase